MNILKKTAIISFAALALTQVNAEVDPNFHCYLLFGQSNMAGGGNTSDLIASDCDTNSRVKVLAFCDCPTSGSGSWTSPDCSKITQKRVHDTWYTAAPPLHICSEGISPGDYFSKTMLDSINSDIKIGLIPCALSGQSAKVFVKGSTGNNIPNWAHPTLANASAYEWMLSRCKIAQQTGVIKGILFHQGENDVGQSWWISTVSQIFDDLKKDLGLDSKLPVVVGELVQDGACCSSHNPLVDTLAKKYPNCGLVKSDGLKRKDQYHFNAAGMREMGRRYAVSFLSLCSNDYIPRKGSVNAVNKYRLNSVNELKQNNNDLELFSISGRSIGRYSDVNVSTMKKSGGIYILSGKFKNGVKATIPVIK